MISMEAENTPEHSPAVAVEIPDFFEALNLPQITGEEFVETVDTIDELALTVFEESQPVTHVRDLPTEKDNKSNKAGVLDFLPGWKTTRLRPLNSQVTQLRSRISSMSCAGPSFRIIDSYWKKR